MLVTAFTASSLANQKMYYFQMRLSFEKSSILKTVTTLLRIDLRRKLDNQTSETERRSI